jgi:hypothetical protein
MRSEYCDMRQWHYQIPNTHYSIRTTQKMNWLAEISILMLMGFAAICYQARQCSKQDGNQHQNNVSANNNSKHKAPVGSKTNARKKSKWHININFFSFLAEKGLFAQTHVHVLQQIELFAQIRVHVLQRIGLFMTTRHRVLQRIGQFVQTHVRVLQQTGLFAPTHARVLQQTELFAPTQAHVLQQTGFFISKQINT